MQVLYLGRAPRIKETLPDFREKCRVTRHSRVFRELTGSQRTPRIWGVTFSIQNTKQWMILNIFVFKYLICVYEIYPTCCNTVVSPRLFMTTF